MNFIDCDCSFRGYPLQGKEVTVPAGYKGMILIENKKLDGENKNRNLYCTKTFSKFRYWNYDRIPSKNDAIIAALDWIDVAETVSNFSMDSLINNSSILTKLVLIILVTFTRNINTKGIYRILVKIL